MKALVCDLAFRWSRTEPSAVPMSLIYRGRVFPYNSRLIGRSSVVEPGVCKENAGSEGKGYGRTASWTLIFEQPTCDGI